MIMPVPSVMVTGPVVLFELDKISKQKRLPELLPIYLVFSKIITDVVRLWFLLCSCPSICT